jgi:AAA family ATP:ADP antiporter
MKSYAYATIAAVLLVGIPVYGQLFRRAGKVRMTRWVTVFFVTTLLLFWAIGRAGLDIGFAYYVWVGVAALVLTAQFWGYAADTYDVPSGQRLFPAIMLGATLGGLVGPVAAGLLFPLVGPWNLMLLAALLLVATLPLVSLCRAAVPASSSNAGQSPVPAERHPLGGLALVFRDHYLLMLAALILLLNWVNTTGEYILAELVVRQADARMIADPVANPVADPVADRATFIATFYSSFYFMVNALTVAIQLFFVARVFRWAGVSGAVLVLPLLACVGYGAVAFVPVLTLVGLVKVLENATDYSLMNTARHALYLPLPAAHKYEGKLTVETLFWRLGDLLQAGMIFAGLHWLGFGVSQFAWLNALLALVWLLVAMRLGGLYAGKAGAQPAFRPMAREV